jgi:hypothetical protein
MTRRLALPSDVIPKFVSPADPAMQYQAISSRFSVNLSSGRRSSPTPTTISSTRSVVGTVT